MAETECQRVLVVDDDATVVDVVRRYLEREGFAVETASDGPGAMALFEERPPELVVLDLMLPGVDGLEVCRRMRGRRQVPVIMLTALGAEHDRISGLETGADDYVTKPFSPRELTARVKAVLRRAGPSVDMTGPPILEAGELRVDTVAHEVLVAGVAVTLTTREFELLVFLMRSPRQAWRREELLEHVWGWTYGDTSTVTVHVRRLREKVERNPAHPCHLCTVWGVGYRFEP